MLQTTKDFFDELIPYISFKTFIGHRDYLVEVKKCVNWLDEYLTKSGFESKVFNHKNSNPLIFAEKILDKNFDTVLLYGHYDVVDPGDLKEWKSEPFALTQRGKKLFARGVADNKGQTFIHLYALQKLIETGRLKKNVKILLEGNEETDNPDIVKFIKDSVKLLKADSLLVSDAPGYNGLPVIECSLRGGFLMTLNLETTKRALHDGINAGGVPNVAHELSKLVSGMVSEDNEVLIKGFEKGVDLVGKRELDLLSELESVTDVVTESGLKRLTLGNGQGFYEKTGLHPTLQITSIVSGYVGDGYGSVIPNTATAKLLVKTVKSQDTRQVLEIVKSYIQNQTPDYISYEILHTEPYQPVKIDVNSADLLSITRAIENSCGKKPYYRFIGGSIPVISQLTEQLKVNPLIVSLANQDCFMHDANENLSIGAIEQGLKVSEEYFSRSSL